MVNKVIFSFLFFSTKVNLLNIRFLKNKMKILSISSFHNSKCFCCLFFITEWHLLSVFKLQKTLFPGRTLVALIPPPYIKPYF
jgi:hypothetical protein